MRKPAALLMATLLLGACSTNDDDPDDILQPEVTFSPDSVRPGFETGLELIVRNKGSRNLENVHVEYVFPPGVHIDGGSVGTLCSATFDGHATAKGYEFTAFMEPDEKCGVFMDLVIDTAGDKTFEVEPGKATADGGVANRERYFWTLNVD